MDKHAAIGVFDSGLGGISVLHEIRGLLPSESLILTAERAESMAMRTVISRTLLMISRILRKKRL